MPSNDIRIAGWDLPATAGMTYELVFTSNLALTSLAVYVGGTLDDVTDLTGATAYNAVLSGGNLIATVDLPVPTGEATPLRLVVDGAVATAGYLRPSTAGAKTLASSDVTITTGSINIDLAVPSTAGHGHAGVYDPAGTASSAVAAHEADTTNVHGIADTSVLETTTGAQTKADAAQAAAVQRANHTGTQLSTTISDLTEAIQDAVGAMATDGTTVNFTYDDVGGTLTAEVQGLTSANVSDFAEAVDDRVAALVQSTDLTVTYDDVAGTLTFAFAADMATQAELDAHITDVADAHDASAISIADAGAHYTATDVEAALQEVPTLIDNATSSALRVAGDDRVAESPSLSDVTLVTTFAAGHGWVAAGGSGTVTDSTDYSLISSQSVKVTATSGNQEVEKTGLALDLTNRTLCLWVYTGDQNSAGITVYLASSGYTNFRVYEFPASATQELTGWTCLRVHVDNYSAQTGTLTMSNIQTIKFRCYVSASHAIYLGGFGHMADQATYPNGAVAITFDDAHDAVWQYGRPILVDAGYPATIYAIGDVVESNSHLTVDNLQLAEKSFGWEVAGHAATTADHVDLTGVSAAEAEGKITRMREWLLKHGFQGRHFAYPYGSNDATVRALASEYFASAREVDGSYASQPYIGAELPLRSRLDRLPAPSFDTTGFDVVAAQALLDRVAAKGLGQVLCFHSVNTTTSSGGTISTTDLQTLVDYIGTKGISAVTVSDILGIA